MAPRFSSFSSPLWILLLGFILCKVDGTDQTVSAHLHVDLKTVQPRDSCLPSVNAGGSSGRNWTSLRVVHRHGPCSPFAGQQKQLSHAKILDLDQARVDDIHRIVSHYKPLATSDSATTLPARSGAYIGSGNYVVTVGFGTPKKDQTVIFDTGSSVSWIQCRPCVSCYEQEAPLFDPSLSSTYANIPCASSFCDELGNPTCSASNCMYGVNYLDNSSTFGFYVQDTLTLSADSIPGFRFGCGDNNTGLFHGNDGLLGLGRDKPSIVSQTYTKYGGVFSYCLPLTSSSVGYLAFGSYPAGNLMLTPMLSNPSDPRFYYLALTGISVDGQLLSVPPSIFNNSGTVIDSGTVITRLPDTAYSALRSAFRQGMTAYKRVPGYELLDTCYDFSGSDGKGNIPSVALHLGGGVTINLGKARVLYTLSSSQTCLAFASNGDDSSVGILGNTQQKGFNVLYDINKRVIGFGPGGCS
ncbi:aspartyl protease family protein At5g10770-like isoform X2 [Zingiber officinale]|uniref:aspartyl protease family protein At5g10770-like isoform X2 n=1 Tax=Zingiber officinale TaxID=94328 RepID=UPI001C4C6DE8|nr:aspartyl protease family protein At5g10770-like isoform X2 [Zingiber officinale]